MPFQNRDSPISGHNTDVIDDLTSSQNEHDDDKSATVKRGHGVFWLDIHCVHAFSDVCLIAKDRSHMLYINKSVLVANCPLIRVILSGPEYFQEDAIHIQTELPRSHLTMLVDFLSQGVLPPEIDENKNLQSSFLSFGIVTKALKLTPSERTIVKVMSDDGITFGQGCDDVVDDILLSEIVKPEIDLFEEMGELETKDAFNLIESAVDNDNDGGGSDLFGTDPPESPFHENEDVKPLLGHNLEVNDGSEDEKPLRQISRKARSANRNAQKETDALDCFPKLKKENVEPQKPTKKPRKKKKKIALTSSDDSDGYHPLEEVESDSDKEFVPEGLEEERPKQVKAKIPKEKIGKPISNRIGMKYKKTQEPQICKICGKDYQGKSRKSWFVHTYSHKKKACVSCGKTPDSYLHRVTMGPFHTKECHYPSCGTKFKTWEEHKVHVATDHASVYYWKCGKCASLFGTEIEYKMHRREEHRKKPEPKQCSICGMNVKSIQSHMIAKHSTEKFPCELCGKVFNSRNSVKIHIDRKQCPATFERLSCQECGKMFNTRIGLKRHHRVVHTPDNQKPYQCSWCGKGFCGKQAWQEHMNIHTGVKPHKCSVCEMSFNNLSNKFHHERSVHLGLKREEIKRQKDKLKLNLDDLPVTVMDGGHQVFGVTPTFT